MNIYRRFAPDTWQHGDKMVGMSHLKFCRPVISAGSLWPLIAIIAVITIPDTLLAQATRQFPAEGGRYRQSSTRPSQSNRPLNRVAERSSSRFSDVRPITRSPGQLGDAAGKGSVSRSSPSIWKTFGALGLIVAVIVVVGRMWKKHGPKLSGGLPTEAVDVLGKRSIDARQAIYLVRLGSRILVLGSTANGLRTLSEVTDPVEVDYLAGLSRQQDSENGVAQSFRALFSGQNMLNSGQSSDNSPGETAGVDPQAKARGAATRDFLASGRPHA